MVVAHNEIFEHGWNRLSCVDVHDLEREFLIFLVDHPVHIENDVGRDLDHGLLVLG